MSRQDHYMIDLSRLPIGTHVFEIQLDSDFFASLEKSEILSGDVAAKVVLNRCLDPMPIDINDEQEIFSDEEDNDQSSMTTHQLDLSWLAYEIVSINIPLVHSHQAGECNKHMELLLQDHLCDEPDPEIDN